MKAFQLHVTGIVQGVGFRPFVYNLALEQGLSGWVLNASDGVHLVVEGPSDTVNAFPDALRSRAPVMALIEQVIVGEIEPEGRTGYEIRSSKAEQGAMTLVSPDIATCPECLAEMNDPADRRHRYPFINCTNCGPRFTIIDDVPYDRPTTTMRDFPMCPECAEEYGDPRDRRFHAQPDACFVCGPRLYLNPPTNSGLDGLEPDWIWSTERDTSPRSHQDRNSESERSAQIMATAADLLRGGGVLAIKGLGGFHLACDATDSSAVHSLRSRKNRWAKPLAIMVRDVTAARELCEVGDTEAALLGGTVRPIVLLRRRAGGSPSPEVSGETAGPVSLADNVANRLSEMGVMLPYTPLHHLLLEALGRPLVMTSGNLSDEPIATGNQEALDRLSSIADGLLLHDRDIRSRYDDSVVRVVGDVVEPVRRSRGYAPHPLRMPFSADTAILAAGPEQKNTFTLLTGEYAFVSQHIGDMENAETLASFESTLSLYKRLFRVEPQLIAHDSHPEYLSTKWALEQGLPTVDVQHHHAHIVSVTAEHGISEKVVGVSFDGTGYGADGHIWGGEFLVCDWAECERYAHLRYVPMPGGSAAIRRPARMALGTLQAYGLLDHPGARPLLSRLVDGEQRTLLTMIDRGVNCPLTSSMGRLFDSVAALTGVADDAGYEGEAAILLEAAADPSASGAYSFELNEPETEDGPLVVDAGSLLATILSDVDAGIPAGVISTRFHRAIVGCIVTVGAAAATRSGTSAVALAGGVFMNRLVLGGAIEGLREAGLTPLTHISLPLNDGAVSLGQAVVAWTRRQEK